MQKRIKLLDLIKEDLSLVHSLEVSPTTYKGPLGWIPKQTSKWRNTQNERLIEFYREESIKFNIYIFSSAHILIIVQYILMVKLHEDVNDTFAQGKVE